jgi:hypothetical protein
MPQPQLPKTISTAEEEEKIKSKPRIKMVTKIEYQKNIWCRITSDVVVIIIRWNYDCRRY